MKERALVLVVMLVMGGDSCFKGREFESWHCILDGHFFTFICCKNCVFGKWIYMKKRPGLVHLKKVLFCILKQRHETVAMVVAQLAERSLLSRGPRFISSHRQKFILNNYWHLYRKDENNEKEARNGPFLKTLNDDHHSR